MKRQCLALGVCVGILAGAAPADEELIWQGGRWVKQAPAVRGTPAGEVSLLRQDLDGRQYADAVKHADEFLKRYAPPEPLREDALGLAGDAELGREHYWQAYEYYEQQLREFPNGAGIERALGREMEVAEAFLGGKKRIAAKVFRLPAQDDGIEILGRVAEHAPGTLLAETALMRIADYYYAKSAWADAVTAYDNFLKIFPRSERAIHAELQAAHALRLSYRGAAYDEGPLIEAEQRYGAFARNRPSAAKQARVEEILRDIRQARGQKQFEVAQFYLRTGKRQSAIFYLELVADKYDDTDWAAKAESELARLGAARQAASQPTSLPGRGQPPRKEAKP
jgi:outer membrane protein assembly factor BamD